MARRSIEDVMVDIEEFLAGCKSAGFSSNKIAVPKDEFDDLFGELKVKIPAEIDRCKKIMRNKEAILMNARKEADTMLAQANVTAQQLISETTIVQQANQQAYDTIELAKAQANEILADAVAQANEVRLGSMQYTNDIMMGLRNYIEATMNAERANYENLLQTLNNEYMVAGANLEEIQTQIVEFTGDPSRVTKAPDFQTGTENRSKEGTRQKSSVVQKVRQAVGMKEEVEANQKPSVDIPDFISSGESVVPNETPLEVSAKTMGEPVPNASAVQVPNQLKKENEKSVAQALSTSVKTDVAATVEPAMNHLDSDSGIVGAVGVAPSKELEGENEGEKKIKKKIVRKRTPVIHTPQTPQEAVAKTVEAALVNKTEKTVYKANGEQAREVPPMEGNVKRGPRVGRADVSEETVSVGTLDDLTMDKKY